LHRTKSSADSPRPVSKEERLLAAALPLCLLIG
jgi:hypothetical protein